MAYADYAQTDDYVSKVSGSHVGIVMYDSENPTTPLISAATGINWTGDFEKLRVEEAGEDGTNEIVDGRHSVAGTISALFTSERNDSLPSRQDFIGREFTIMEVIAPGRVGQGTPINVFTGCKLSRNGSSHGARGLKTTDLAFEGIRRYTGAEWAAKAAS